MRGGTCERGWKLNYSDRKSPCPFLSASPSAPIVKAFKKQTEQMEEIVCPPKENHISTRATELLTTEQEAEHDAQINHTPQIHNNG
mmetsp:Transcript_11955/g.21708  ORF Transcript_11955/g.21708 Transcript_11955/m.21708 type:complete len:86 (+) Transcript_11955:29-286(+)